MVKSVYGYCVRHAKTAFVKSSVLIIKTVHITIYIATHENIYTYNAIFYNTALIFM